jgi:hypothetical protein
VTIDLATEDDFGAFIELAGEVEEVFGPMVDEPGFHDAVRRNISRRSALLARDSLGTPAGRATGRPADDRLPYDATSGLRLTGAWTYDGRGYPAIAAPVITT